MLISSLDNGVLRPAKPSNDRPYRGLPRDVLYAATKYNLPITRNDLYGNATDPAGYEFPGDLTNGRKN